MKNLKSIGLWFVIVCSLLVAWSGSGLVRAQEPLAVFLTENAFQRLSGPGGRFVVLQRQDVASWVEGERQRIFAANGPGLHEVVFQWGNVLQAQYREADERALSMLRELQADDPGRFEELSLKYGVRLLNQD